MAHLKEVVDRINLIGFTQQITQAMKMVSASKLHKIQQVLLPLKVYTREYNRLLHRLLQAIDEGQLTHPLTKAKIGKRLLVVVMGSNRGLCGAFNKNVLRAANEYITTRQKKASTTIEVLVIGKKVHQFFKKYDIPLIERYVNLVEKANDQASSELATYCIEGFEQNHYTEIVLAYTAFKNSAKQEVVIVPFLPFLPNLDLATDTPPSSTRSLDYIYEPSQELLIAQLIPEILKHKMMHMLVESSASEHAARMATMTQATDNADELLKVLRISYNRTRQALITNSLAEITSGAEALAET
ncbi:MULTISPECIES: ATP synthase F1 subunit gamma [unclassified Candidatus Cardinium]|uniref:ATP synthase F1 subunit gamma n=1 Tax=unclassified Candidatus Cardinium TaxID=2641185 RepID=UPI001FB1BE60|nr:MULTISPECIES: ATP synthase F1 subunit gamma [unclassified Candidatus Cardinium]